MKLRTTLPADRFPAHALRHMVSWVCQQIGYPIGKLKLATYYRARGKYGGLCHGRGRFGVRFNPDAQFPIRHNRFGWNAEWHDGWELLVAITAHEVAHCNDYIESGRTNERSAEMQEQKVLAAFREDADALLAKWMLDLIKQPKPQHAKKPIQEKRAEKASKMLAAWQRKAKLAAGKVKKYRRQVAYYEKALAAKRAK